MKKVFSLFLIAGSIVFFMACNADPNQQADTRTGDSAVFDLDAARAWIESDNAKFSQEIKMGDTAALGSHYSSDGMLMMSNSEPAKGKDIASSWGSTVRQGVKELKITTVDLIGNADLLVETGNYELYGDANKLMDKGKYVVVWKQENGTWKIYRDIGNSNLPAAPVK